MAIDGSSGGRRGRPEEEEEVGEGVLGVVVRLQLCAVVDVLRYPGTASSMAAPWFSSGWVFGWLGTEEKEQRGREMWRRREGGIGGS